MNDLSIQDMLLFQTVHQEATRLWLQGRLPHCKEVTWDQAISEAHASVTEDLSRFADLQKPFRSR